MQKEQLKPFSNFSCGGQRLWSIAITQPIRELVNDGVIDFVESEVTLRLSPLDGVLHSCRIDLLLSFPTSNGARSAIVVEAQEAHHRGQHEVRKDITRCLWIAKRLQSSGTFESVHFMHDFYDSELAAFCKSVSFRRSTESHSSCNVVDPIKLIANGEMCLDWIKKWDHSQLYSVFLSRLTEMDKEEPMVTFSTNYDDADCTDRTLKEHMGIHFESIQEMTGTLSIH